MSSFKRISVDQAEHLLDTHDNALLLDMRDARAFCQGHHPKATHLSDVNLRTLLKRTPSTVHVLICCYHGNASQDMAKLFADFGFPHCYSVDGGYEAWRSSMSAPLSPLSEPLIQWLTARGFSHDHLNARFSNNETALMRAAREGEHLLVRELLEAGADPDLRNADGNTAVWLACFSGHLPTLQALIDAGADLDNQNDNGATALIYSASAGKNAMVECLLLAGADTGLTTLDDFSALDVAANRTVLTLLRHPAPAAEAAPSFH